MKKSILILLLFSLTLGIQAQTYKQRLSNRINVIDVTASNNVIIKVVEDSSNYVSVKHLDAYGNIIHFDTNAITSMQTEAKGFFAREALVKVDSNTLTTTPAANGKILTVGTTERNALTFKIEGDNMIIYDGQTYTYQGTTTVEKHETYTDERDWTGMKKYKFSNRLQWNFCFGKNWLGGLTNRNLFTSGIPEETSILAANSRWGVGYSIYMDEHVAAGIGLEWLAIDIYPFSTNYVKYENNALSAPEIENPDRWCSYISNFSVNLPIHFIYYPSAKSHTIKLMAELIPKFKVATIDNYYSYYDDNDLFQETRTLSYNLNAPLFGLDMRFSVQALGLGFYVETGLIPFSTFNLDDKLALKNGGSNIFTPYHLAFGIKLDLFDAFVH